MKFPTPCDETLADAIDWCPLCLSGHLKASEAIYLWQHYHQRRSDYKIGDIAPVPWALVLDKKNELIGLLPDWRLAAALWTEHFSSEIPLDELCLDFTFFLEFPSLTNFNKTINFFEQYYWDILPIYHGKEKAWGILSIGNIVRQVNLCQLWQNLSLQVIANPPLFLSPDVTLGELIEHSFAQQISTFPILYSSPLLPPSTGRLPLGNARLAYYLNHSHHDSVALESRVGDGISATFPLCVSNQNYCQAREILRQQNYDYVIVTKINGEFTGWITPQQWLQTLQPEVLLWALQQEIEVPRLVQHLEARIIWQQQQLQRSQYLTHKLLTHNPNLVYLYDLVKNQITFLNYTSILMFSSNADGTTENTFMSKEFQRPLMPLEYFTLENLICLEAHEKKEFNFELTNDEESTHYFVVEISAFEIDQKGNTSKLLCIARDITEGKQTQADLQTKEQQLETLVNTIADGIVILDRRDYVIYANPMACNMFGIVQEDFLDYQLGLSGQNQTEISINLSENEQGVGELKSVPIQWQEEDCRLLTVRDVTDRQQVLKKLRDSKQRYRSLLETLPNLVWRLSPKGKVWECNQQTLTYLGRNGREIVEDGWQNFVYSDDLAVVQRHWREGLASRTMFNLECRLKLLDGQYRWQLFQVLPLEDKGGEIDGWLASITDIDNLKQAEETLRNQAQQEKLLASISQRIRESLKLETILQTTVTEVRRTIQADRVLIYHIEESGLGETVAESVIEQIMPQ